MVLIIRQFNFSSAFKFLLHNLCFRSVVQFSVAMVAYCECSQIGSVIYFSCSLHILLCKAKLTKNVMLNLAIEVIVLIYVMEMQIKRHFCVSKQ